MDFYSFLDAWRNASPSNDPTSDFGAGPSGSAEGSGLFPFFSSALGSTTLGSTPTNAGGQPAGGSAESTRSLLLNAARMAPFGVHLNQLLFAQTPRRQAGERVALSNQTVSAPEPATAAVPPQDMWSPVSFV